MTLSDKKTNTKIQSVEFVRGIMALFLGFYHFLFFESHYGKLIVFNEPFGSILRELLIGALCAFFLLSGKVMLLHLDKVNYTIKDFFPFLFSRLKRLLPLFYLAIAVILGIQFGFCVWNNIPFDFSWKQLLFNLTLSSGLIDNSWYNPIFWTLGIELQFILLIGLLYPLIKRKPVLYIVLSVLLSSLIFHLSGSNNTLLYYHSFFLIGFVLYFRSIGRFSDAMSIGLILLCSIELYLDLSIWFYVLPLLSIPLLWFNIKGSSSLRTLGLFSYSFYLFHGIFGGWFLYFTARYAESLWQIAALIVLAFALSIYGSYLIHRFIEIPFRNRLKHTLKA